MSEEGTITKTKTQALIEFNSFTEWMGIEGSKRTTRTIAHIENPPCCQTIPVWIGIF